MSVDLRLVGDNWAWEHAIIPCCAYRIGRLPVLAMTVAVFAVFGLVRLYVTSFAAIMISTFLASMSFPSMLELALIIGKWNH